MRPVLASRFARSPDCERNWERTRTAPSRWPSWRFLFVANAVPLSSSCPGWSGSECLVWCPVADEASVEQLHASHFDGNRQID